MDMPDKIWARPDTHEGVWQTTKDGYSGETQYTRTDLAQSLADALEGMMKVFDHMTCETLKGMSYHEQVPYEKAARAALANYRKGE